MIHPSPKVIAIVLGPLSSHPYDRMMEQIGRMYYGKYDPNQNIGGDVGGGGGGTVILASSPPLHFLLNRNLQSIAQEVLHQTSMALLQASPQPLQQIPIIIHSFSNGGAFLQEAIELELGKGNMQQHTQRTAQEKNYEKIRCGMKIGYQFFDSCPCYIRMIWDTSYFTKSFPNEHLPTWVRYLYTLGSALALSTWCILTLSWHRPQQFWNRMIHSTICTNHQIFMYSTTDLLTDAAAMDRFIETRRQQYGVNCTVYRYNDSNHCQFHIDHPNEYQQAIDDALDSVMVPTSNERNRNKEQ
jgi:Eukaryotic protein of unknown function (DUF829)